MGAGKTISRNIASNTAGYMVNMLVALLLSPFVVRSLGDEIYCVWNIVIALTGSYGLLDLGIRSAVGHYLTIYWSKRDLEGVNRTMNTAMVLMFVAAGIAGVIATPCWAWWAATLCCSPRRLCACCSLYFLHPK